MTRKKLLEADSILAALFAVMLTGLAHFQFVFQQICQKSVNHLEEIYTQVNSAFCFTLTKNERPLRGWRNDIFHTADIAPEKRPSFLQEEKERSDFINFSFLPKDGQRITSQGDTENPGRGENRRQLAEEWEI